MKKLLSFIAFVLTTTTSVAQIPEPVIMQQETVTDKVERCRNLVFDKAINEKDTATVCELLEYAKNQLESNNRVAFSISEYRMLYLMSGQYKKLLENITSIDDSTYYSQIQDYICPRTMNGNDIRTGWRLLLSNIETTENNIRQNTDLTNEEKEFIILFIKESPANREETNRLANDFLSNNPGSVYESFTRKYIRYEYDYYAKFGYEMSFGFGTRINTVSLSDIDNVLFDLDGNIKLLYKRFAFAFDFAIGMGKLNNEIQIDDVILFRDAQIRTSNVGFTLGYKIPVWGGQWYLYPATGIQALEISDNLPEDESPNVSQNGKWKPYFTLDLGRDCLRTLIRTRRGKLRNAYFTLGLHYAFCPAEIHLQSGDYNGYSHIISLCFGIGTTRAKRVY